MWEEAGAAFPADGEDVIIPAEWRIVINEDTPKIKNLECRGTIIIPNNLTKKVTIYAEQIWFNGIGKIIPGTKDVIEGTILEDPKATFEKEFEINCRGT